MKVRTFTSLGIGLGLCAGCASQGPPDLLPTPTAHRTVEVSPEADQFGPKPDQHGGGVAMITASSEPVVRVRSATKPVWWFDGERSDAGERVLCVEALAGDLAGARRAVRAAAHDAFAGQGDIVIRELAAAPVANPGGALRYVAYAMVVKPGQG